MKQTFKLTSYTVDWANAIPTLRLWLEYNNKEYYAFYDKNSYAEFKKLPELDKGNYYDVTFDLYNNNKDYQSVVGMYVSKIEKCTDIDNYDKTYDTTIQALILHINNYYEYMLTLRPIEYRKRLSKLQTKLDCLNQLTAKEYTINYDTNCVEEVK